MQGFKSHNGLQNAVLSYIASQKLCREEEKSLRDIFIALDTNKDGFLTKEEILAGYERARGKSGETQKEVDKMMMRVDLNKNGRVDYNGNKINS